MQNRFNISYALISFFLLDIHISHSFAEMEYYPPGTGACYAKHIHLGHLDSGRTYEQIDWDICEDNVERERCIEEEGEDYRNTEVSFEDLRFCRSTDDSFYCGDVTLYFDPITQGGIEGYSEEIARAAAVYEYRTLHNC